MKLQRLGTRLAVLDTRRLPVLETKAGTTPRTRGEAWMKTRRQVLLRDGFACVDCGCISMSNQIDHDTPLEQGGTDDHRNLKVRCPECHKAKTATETKQRFGK
jgi:5-methylcytosine-specific restriction enzyme A